MEIHGKLSSICAEDTFIEPKNSLYLFAKMGLKTLSGNGLVVYNANETIANAVIFNTAIASERKYMFAIFSRYQLCKYHYFL